MLAVAGVTATAVKVGAVAVTVTPVEPVTPFIDAVIDVLPAPTPVVMPVILTIATP
jgi:hypothetical protein